MPSNVAKGRNQVTSGALTSVAAGDEFICSARDFKIDIGGTFVGTVVIERFNEQANAWAALETFTAPAARNGYAPSGGERYRANCTAYTSGTINYEFSASNDF